MVLDVLTSCSALICWLLFTRQVIDIRLYAMRMLFDIEDNSRLDIIDLFREKLATIELFF